MEARSKITRRHVINIGQGTSADNIEPLTILKPSINTTYHQLFSQPAALWQILRAMAVFQNKKFRSKAETNTIAARYRSALSRHPFMLFGLPFIATMVAGSFFLTPATAIRYEKHDRRVRRMSKEEELGIGKAGRKVDMNEEYYVRMHHINLPFRYSDADCMLYRDWQRKIWMIGNRSVSRDFQESMMV